MKPHFACAAGGGRSAIGVLGGSCVARPARRVPRARRVHARLEASVMAPFLGDELWVLIAAQLADSDVCSLGRLACVSRRFNSRSVADPDHDDQARTVDASYVTPILLSIVDASARRACATCSEHISSCTPRLRGQPLLRLLWERRLLSRPAMLTTVGLGRTEFSDAGAVAFQPRMPLAEQREVWTSSDMEPAFALVPSEDNNVHSATCVVLEYSQLLVGSVPLRAGQHYMELELAQNSLVPAGGTASTAGPSTTRFGVVSGPLAWSGIAPHALWNPVPRLNERSGWAQFTDTRGRNYYVRDQNAIEIAEHDSTHLVYPDDNDRTQQDPGDSNFVVPVDPTFASEERVMAALSYEAVASVTVPPEGVRVKLTDDNTDDYYFDNIPGQQWLFDAANGDMIGCGNIRSKWEGQRAAREKDSVGLLLDIEAGTLDVYLNELRLGRMACGLNAFGPFRFVAEICTDAKVRVVSKPPPQAQL